MWLLSQQLHLTLTTYSTFRIYFSLFFFFIITEHIICNTYVYYFCLHCLRKNAILLRKISIIHINTLKYWSTIVNELAFQKRHLYMFVVLVYVHTENCIQHLVGNPSFSLSIILLLAGDGAINPGPKTFKKTCALPLLIFNMSVINLLPFLIWCYLNT